MVAPKANRIVLLGLLCALAAIVFAWNALSKINEFERNTNAAKAACVVLHEFVYKKKRWPRDETEVLSEVNAGTSFLAWPRDHEQILSRVTIRYDTTIDAVAASRSRTFPYLTPTMPLADSYYDVLQRVIDECRAIHACELPIEPQ